jgi:6-phosphogluconolactonase (cycloisomerase 2 family)
MRRMSGRAVFALMLAVLFGALCATSALAAEGDIAFVGCLEDTGAASACPAIPDGLNDAFDVAVSPDGKNVYVTGSADSSLVAFSRDTTTGALTFLDQEDNGVGGVIGLGGATGVTVSPDGKHVYATAFNDSALTTFARNPATGALSFVGCLEDTGAPSGCPSTGGIDGLGGPFAAPSVSPDGKHVYVASFGDDAIASFTRNPATGALTFIGCLEDTGGASGCPSTGGVDGVLGARSVASSPDGKHVYVAGAADGALAIFSRNATTGALTFTGCLEDTGGASGCPSTGGVDGLAGAADFAITPDGRHLYVSGSSDDALSIFSRDSTTGALTFVGCLEDTGGASATCPNAGGTTDGLDGVRDVAVSPDGKSVYAAGADDDALATLSRNPVTGALTFVGCLEDTGAASGCPSTGGVDALDAIVGVSVAPDGGSVYTASFVDSAVGAFARDPDLTTPDTTGLSGPQATTDDNTPTFSFTSDDTPFNQGFECKVDEGPFFDCSSPYTSFALADGPHRLQVRAIDTAGNVDATPAESNFTVDTTAPATSINAGPPTTSADNTPTFTFSANDALAGFECRLDGDPFATCSSPFTSAALADGSHRFQVRATDAVGNLEASPAESSFTVDTSGPVVTPPAPVVPDTTAPDTELTAEPASSLSAKKKTAKAKFEFAASEAGSRFECRLDSASFSSCSSPQNLKLKLGPHTFRVRAIDAAGNADFSAAKWQGTVVKKPKKG